MKKDFCFIVPSYCSSDLHLHQLRRCLSSIRKHHENKIFIIDDYSDKDVKPISLEFDNIEIVESPVKAAGDMVTYSFFLENKNFQKAVIFQDSMNLETALVDIDKIENISHIWFFTNHRLHWSHIKEPKTEYNINNNINVHDDLILNCIDKMIDKEDFKIWLKDIYHQKDKWAGNIGCQSIVDHDFLVELNNKTGIVELMKKMNNNRLRRVAESLFPLACQYVVGDDIVGKSYDGIYYDGVNSQSGKRKYQAKELGIGTSSEVVEQVCKNTYFSKATFNRRPVKTN